ncbi:hypothetical protein E8L99_21465 [Phreatobacter aquaticus]|uniref:DUF4149 domain-containing protein n=1 Tax=Phreatobacter aquaticus TaxID=2570229 RepID=A0A4D7QQ85_9HYPH|nr:hypothetical protein [Phreatobacter aquaticus]QCK88143.1 hypothetical protein E8L99_21465 [Phreatobacter aquaticus]
MSLDPIALIATVILLLPMGYFLLAAPGFLLVKLDIAPVTVLMRSMFSGYFRVLTVAAIVSTLAFATEGRLATVAGIALIAGGAIVARAWFLRRMDAELSARDGGDAAAVGRLRRLHWEAMGYNAAQLAVLIASVPHMVLPV